MNKQITKLIIEALEAFGYIEDGFVKEPVTVALDSDIENYEKIQVANGDWRQYWMAYEFTLFLHEGETEENIEMELDLIEAKRETNNLIC